MDSPVNTERVLRMVRDYGAACLRGDGMAQLRLSREIREAVEALSGAVVGEQDRDDCTPANLCEWCRDAPDEVLHRRLVEAERKNDEWEEHCRALGNTIDKLERECGDWQDRLDVALARASNAEMALQRLNEERRNGRT